jgi:aryl-alcohol dehydrogenase-like predicted oxidoreductase
MSQMKTRTLGGTGIPVSEMALGTMMLGPMGNTERDESVAIIHAALDAGITLIDTADVYSGGVSEEIVGAAIRGRRDDVVLATKVGFPSPGRGAFERGGSPRWIKAAVEASLRRLGTEYIDLYQLHRPDYRTSIEETLGAFDDLIRAGKIRAAGASMYPAELITEAQWVAERRGLHRFWTEQPRYSILNRTPETAVFPTTERFGMGVLTFGPLASGWLSGRRDPASGHRATLAPQGFDLSIPANQDKASTVESLAALSHDLGVSMSSLATAFVRAHPAVTSVILGPRTRVQLDDLLTGADVELDDAALDRIDELVAPGTELNPQDNYLTDNPALTDRQLRRRRR